MKNAPLSPAIKLLATVSSTALLLFVFCTTALTQDLANSVGRKQPIGTHTRIQLVPIQLGPLTPEAQLILDPGFEAGDPWPSWTTQSSTNFDTPLCDVGLCGTGNGTAPPFAGSNWAWFGGIDAPETATLGQSITIPSGVTATLTFQLRIGEVATPFTDTLTVKMDGMTLTTFTEPAVAEAAYTLRTFDVSAFANGASHTLLFTYVGPTTGICNMTVDDVFLNTSGGAPTVSSAVSRKTHGGVGAFDVDLPLTGPAGIECRAGGATNDYTMVVTFSANVTVGGSPQAQVTSGMATIGSGGVSNGGAVTVSGSAVTIPLTNVQNVQTINVQLNNVNGSTNVTVPMSVLIGDTNATAAVNAGDTSQTKGRSGQTTDATNFRSDVNTDGTVNAGDTTQVKARSGTALP